MIRREQQRLSGPIRRACLTITCLSFFFACSSVALAESSAQASSPPQPLGHYTIRGSPFRSSIEAREHMDPTFQPVLQQETPLCSVPLIQQQQDVSSQPAAARFGQGGGGQGLGFGANSVASGQYTPPDPSECPWTRAVLEFSVSARADQQRDRVGAVWIDGVEVLRTTTPVPTESGTFSRVRRDVTRYSSLLRRQEGGDQQGQGGGASVVVALEDVVMGGGGAEASEEAGGEGDFQVNAILHFYGTMVPGAGERFGGRGSQYGQQQEQGPFGQGPQYGQQEEEGTFGGGGQLGPQYGQEEQGPFGGGGQGPQYGQQEGGGTFGGGGQGPQFGQQEGQGSFGGGGRGPQFEQQEEGQGSFGGGGSEGPQYGLEEGQGSFGPGQGPPYGQQQNQQRPFYPLNNRRVLRKSDAGEQSSSVSQEALHLLYGKPADLIIPISNVDQQQGGVGGGGRFPQLRYGNPTETPEGTFGGGGGGSRGSGYWFRIENEFDSPSRTIQIPPNTHRAVLEIFASSHLDDEFWYSTPFISREATTRNNQSNPFPFPPGRGGAGGGANSLRQVFASVDGLFVGSAVPFPVVYSGGINPLFWSPVASLGAFNLPTYDLDLTPFLGNLLDGSAHELRLGVSGAQSFWLVDANLHLWLDQGSTAVQGKLVRYRAPTLSVGSSSSSQGFDGQAKSKIEAERKLLFSGWVSSSLGNLTTHVEQNLEFKSSVEYKHDGRTLAVDAKCKCETEVKVKDEGDVFVTKMQRRTKYPLKIETSLQVEEVGAYRSRGSVSHEMNREVTVEYTGVKYTDEINNQQKADGWMLVNGDEGSVLAGSARSEQTYSTKSRDGCYRRSLTVQDGEIQHDGVSPSCSFLGLALTA